MLCKHTREHSRWVNDYEDDWGTIIEGHYEYNTENTTIDIDLHRYKCTQCDEIMYYSGRAREYYEEGKKFEWISGLDK